MPERRARTEILHLGAPMTVGAVTLLPIERVVVHSTIGGACAWLAASKEAYALVVRDDGGTRAIEMNGVSVSLESLRERIPGLDLALASM
jgi:hypothetical protein